MGNNQSKDPSRWQGPWEIYMLRTRKRAFESVERHCREAPTANRVPKPLLDGFIGRVQGQVVKEWSAAVAEGALGIAVFRIRWTEHVHSSGYNCRGLFECLKHRIFTQMIEHRIIVTKQAIALGFNFKPHGKQLRIVGHALAKSMTLGTYPEHYKVFLALHLRDLAMGIHGRMIPASWVRGVHGNPYGTRTLEQKESIIAAVLKEIPLAVRTSPAGRTCWFCKRGDKTQVCGNCHIARYCDKRCQDCDWRNHELTCDFLENLFTKQGKQRFHQVTSESLHAGDTFITFEDVVHRCLLHGSGHRYGL